MSADGRDKSEHARDLWSQDYATHRPRLHAYAWRLTGDSAAAEDVVQNVILKILRLTPDPESVADKLGYLLRSVHNASMDWLKKQSRITTVILDRREWQEMVAPERNADAEAENDEYRLAVSVVMRRLTKREKTLLTLFLEGYMCEEIAGRMNEDKRAISYDLNAVRTKVRYQLQKRLGLTKPQGGRRKKDR
jgi:RNA polymerase sigma-70 factor (ECF subfamily)